MRLVFDTNVYLAAAAKADGFAWKQLRRAHPGGPYEVYLSPEIILEIREKLEGKFAWSAAESAEFIRRTLSYVHMVQPSQRITDVLKDTDDHIILECAVEAKAQAIVSADRGLLGIKEFEGITIFHPTMLQYLR